MSNSNRNNLVRRPPVVVIMGHIDHGKSTILDYIRKTNIVAGEAGGITQHVGAYQAEHTGSDGIKQIITFLDTPGHAAFVGIRERGVKAADIAILAVSAEDGVKPQTIEAFKTIKSGNIPFIVAITKIDKPNADINKAKQSLGENEIYVEGWGGDVPCVAISAITGQGISELLDMIMLVAELADLKSDPESPAIGIIIESSLDTRKGVTATILVRNGTLKIGSFLVAGDSFTPVRFIENFKGEKIQNAFASMPVIITGWNNIPECGNVFETVSNKKEAENMTSQAIRSVSKIPISNVEQNPDLVILPLILKADAIGSLEGVKHELVKIDHEKVKIKIVSEGIGEINENDIKMAISDPSIIVIGFNVKPDKKSASMIERSSVPLNVGNFKIIYDLSQYVKEALEAKIPKEYVEEVTGRAKILAIFSKDKDRQVVGGKVETGLIESGNDVRIIRRNLEIVRGKIRELQQQKKRTDEVREGYEFGSLIEAKMEIAIGDRIEAIRTVEKS